jgi:hypothetical protein
LAQEAGFELRSIEGNWRMYTANFVKPEANADDGR